MKARVKQLNEIFTYNDYYERYNTPWEWTNSHYNFRGRILDVKPVIINKQLFYEDKDSYETCIVRFRPNWLDFKNLNKK